ncbi:hypothetical protein, partial [Thermosulfurimonas sp.]|uniref:hypothetical protein n=1 Tax=Thermosulfurimonas sp. TaxID=2080236 RepID=UPI0025F5E324
MNINRLLILSLVLSLALHLALFLWNGFPGLRSSGSPSPEKKSILLTFRLSGPSTPGPSRKSPVKRES